MEATKIEIIDSEKEIFLRDVPVKFRKVILTDIKKNLHTFRNNKGCDVRVIGIGVKYYTNAKVNVQCLPQDAVVASISVKFDRLDRTRENGYSRRSTGHIGLSVYLPKMIMKNRSNLIDNILDN